MSEAQKRDQATQESVWRICGAYQFGARFVPVWAVPAGKQFLTLQVICCMN